MFCEYKISSLWGLKESEIERSFLTVHLAAVLGLSILSRDLPQADGVCPGRHALKNRSEKMKIPLILKTVWLSPEAVFVRLDVHRKQPNQSLHVPSYTVVMLAGHCGHNRARASGLSSIIWHRNSRHLVRLHRANKEDSPRKGYNRKKKFGQTKHDKPV